MRTAAVLCSLFVGAAYAAPQEGLALALADAKTLDKETCYYTRYLDGTHLTPERRAFYTRNLQLHINLINRTPRFHQPRQIAGGQLLAMDLRYLDVGAAGALRVFTVWERFVDREPYYHQPKEPGGATYYVDHLGARVATASNHRRRQADHLPLKQVQELYALTYSVTPVVTMDWFFAMTAVEADRGGIGTGYGYYDFLGIKNRDDFFKLAGVNLNDQRSEQSELLAVVLGINSGVAQNDRMVVRRGATDGFLWFTLDFFDNNLDERNPLLFLDPKKGLKHQAERHFATLPNGLAVVIACNDQGVLQETAPDRIGPDSTAHGRDTRIHTAKSCLTCHANGWLKDVNDEVKAIYTYEPKKGYNLLTAVTKEDEIRLQAAYLRDMKRKLVADREMYEGAVRECLGLPNTARDVIQTTSDDYREAYEAYILTPMTLEQAAVGVGVSVDVFNEKLRAYRKNDKLASHIIAPLSKNRPITRNNYETLYPLLQQVTRGVAPP